MSFEYKRKHLLEDIVDRFIDYRGKTPQKTDHGIPLITAKIVKGGFIDTPSEFIAEELYDSWMTRGIPLKGDVLLTTEAPLGEVAQIKTTKKIALAQRLIAIRGKQGVLDNSFLKYYLTSQEMQNKLAARSTGSTVSGIKSAELKKIEVDIPRYSDQQAIACILSSLDDKIELNNRMNKTLEEIAQTLFNRWFVDFEFTDENGNPYKSSGGKMVESELGMIPEGWSTKEFVDFIDINPTRKIKKGDYCAFLEMKNVSEKSNLRISQYEKKQYLGSGTKFMNGDTIIARITPCLENGKSAFIDFLESDSVGFGSTEFIVFGSNKLHENYVYRLTRADNFRRQLISSMTGTSGRQRANTRCLDNYKVIMPTESILRYFNSQVNVLNSKVYVNDMEVKRLALIRDTLLPKLMSGEIRITQDESNSSR